MLKFRLSFVRDVYFGWNSISQLKGAIQRMRGEKVLVITGKHVGKKVVPHHISPVLNSFHFEVWDGVAPEPDVEVAEAARDYVREGKFDVVVGVGGGSALDTAKIAACLAHADGAVESYADRELPQRKISLILCPTTAGTGSEVTNLAVLELETPENTKFKHVFQHDSLYADAAIVDPSLTLSAPPSVTVSAALDALCHAIEAYVSTGSNPFTDMLAARSVSDICMALKEVSSGKNGEARQKMSLAALLAGIAFNNAGTNLGHALGYAHSHLHGSPHGISVAVTMPYVLQHNAPSCLEKHITIARLLGESVDGLKPLDAALKSGTAFLKLLEELGAPTRLSDLGVLEAHAPEIVDRIFLSRKHVSRNPREVREDQMLKLVKDAIQGNLRASQRGC